MSTPANKAQPQKSKNTIEFNRLFPFLFKNQVQMPLPVLMTQQNQRRFGMNLLSTFWARSVSNLGIWGRLFNVFISPVSQVMGMASANRLPSTSETPKPISTSTKDLAPQRIIDGNYKGTLSTTTDMRGYGEVKCDYTVDIKAKEETTTSGEKKITAEGEVMLKEDSCALCSTYASLIIKIDNINHTKAQRTSDAKSVIEGTADCSIRTKEVRALEYNKEDGYINTGVKTTVNKLIEKASGMESKGQGNFTQVFEQQQTLQQLEVNADVHPTTTCGLLKKPITAIMKVERSEDSEDRAIFSPVSNQ